MRAAQAGLPHHHHLRALVRVLVNVRDRERVGSQAGRACEGPGTPPTPPPASAHAPKRSERSARPEASMASMPDPPHALLEPALDLNALSRAAAPPAPGVPVVTPAAPSPQPPRGAASAAAALPLPSSCVTVPRGARLWPRMLPPYSPSPRDAWSRSWPLSYSSSPSSEWPDTTRSARGSRGRPQRVHGDAPSALLLLLRRHSLLLSARGPACAVPAAGGGMMVVPSVRHSVCHYKKWLTRPWITCSRRGLMRGGGAICGPFCPSL